MLESMMMPVHHVDTVPKISFKGNSYFFNVRRNKRNLLCVSTNQYLILEVPKKINRFQCEEVFLFPLFGFVR